MDAMATADRTWDAVLFDLDGTLIDSVPLILESFHHSFMACGLPVPSGRELLGGIGTPLDVHFARYAPEAVLVARLVACYREHNLAHHDARIAAFPGVRGMLEAIRALRVPRAVVTSKNRSTAERGLRVAGLAHLIDVIVSSDDVGRPKPHAEPAERATALLGVPAARTLFVGDSLHDLHCGRAAGVRTAAALWGPFRRDQLAGGRPDYWIETPEQLCPTVGFRPEAAGDRGSIARRGGVMSEQLVCVKIFVNRQEAELARGALEASGIRAAVASDDAGGAIPGLELSQGVGVFVRETDLAAAQEALQAGA
jgi:pyrophosphatase PpaX